jgi:hypothetical protein
METRLLKRAGFEVTVMWSSKHLEAIPKPDFTVILNEVKDLNSINIRDSSLRSE